MTPKQWDKLLAVIDGELVEPMPVGFIIDSPWLPGWSGISALDYFSSEQMWFEANLKAVRRFPEVMFLPGFWSEFGMCTEPSAFGSKCCWQEDEPPFARKVVPGIAQVGDLVKPNPRTDGLLPFVLNRLRHYRRQIEQAGHAIKFAVARGPLNIASFLLDSTEFLMAIRTDPDRAHRLLGTVTDFIIDWLALQAETFSSIDGVLILDDIVGFLGPEDFKAAALPYLTRIFKSLDVAVRFFHNDAGGIVCAPYLEQMGVNLFNFSYEHALAEMKELTGNAVTLLGNIPTRDVLAAGTPADVRDSVRAALEGVRDPSRIILSCGGGMPGGVSTENIEALISAAG
jgi:uroporphyrinogen-III decarboxylase